MRDHRVQEVFAAILDVPQGDRQAALDRACAEDVNLRAEVASLLSAHDRAGRFMGNPTEVRLADSRSSAASYDQPGTILGRYQLLRQIGEGGFGVVFLAQQTEPIKRRVALKIIKLGMDTRQVVARFEAERQALAMMDHPHIAQVLDAGTTPQGRPFFVMEWVRGEPITDYCNRESLSIRKRLELLIQVCQAIQHAHQKGIIHRDLKPSNVLVTMADSHPLAKVIDFGIAKAMGTDLTEKTVFTEFRQFMGTPEYMSPEQADRAATDIDTRSDVYSLGVLLYEILTGTTPFDGSRLRSLSSGDLQRLLCDEEPPAPSHRVSQLGDRLQSVARARGMEPLGMASTLRGELDWIAMKAMDKDRTRRYPSAQSLADDLARYLRNDPVEAGPAQFRYRFGRFARRHRAFLTAAGVGLLVLVLGLAGTTQGLVWALRERDRAQMAEKEAAEHAAKTKRFVALIGSPLMQPDDIRRFKADWQREIEQSRAARGGNDREQIAEECRFASWLGFTSLTNDLPELAEEARRYQERIHPRAAVAFAQDDPVYVSLVLARIQTSVYVHLHQHRSGATSWIYDIDAATAQNLLPLYRDLMAGLKAFIPEEDTKYQQILLEQAWMQMRAGELHDAAATLAAYLNWHAVHGFGDDVRFQELHRQRVQVAADLLKPHEGAFPQLYQQIAAIAQHRSESTSPASGDNPGG